MISNPPTPQEEADREVEQFEAWLREGHLDPAQAEAVLRAIQRWRPAVVARVGEIMAERIHGIDGPDCEEGGKR
ncbi:MAG: hypothetical protein ABIO70_34750 [Pseudomonadota bacterium]